MLARVRLSNCAVLTKHCHNFVPFSREGDAYPCQFCAVCTFSNVTDIALTHLATVRNFSHRGWYRTEINWEVVTQIRAGSGNAISNLKQRDFHKGILSAN